MKILMIHNHYRSSAPSGEDTVFDNESALLQEAGHEVVKYERFSDELEGINFPSKLGAAAGSIWSSKTYREIEELLRVYSPDVAHFHNTFPLISSSAYAACNRRSIPVVQTMHNYRSICSNGLLLRNGKVCESCLSLPFWPALINRCYRDSYGASFVAALAISVNRRRNVFEDSVSKIIALTEFAKSRLVRGGIPEDMVCVKPNSIGVPECAEYSKGGYALYVGRLSAEKGLQQLMNSWRTLRHVPLRIVGDGPLLERMQTQVQVESLPVTFLGHLSHSETIRQIGAAEFLVVPSVWYEGFPMVVLEAFAVGTLVIASAIGGLQEIVKNEHSGLLFEPANEESIIEVISRAIESESLRQSLTENAKKDFAAKYSNERNLSRLIEIYQSCIN